MDKVIFAIEIKKAKEKESVTLEEASFLRIVKEKIYKEANVDQSLASKLSTVS